MTVYYVDNCSLSGSDTNAGVSADAPLLSLAAVNKLALKAGDVVAFRAGGTYSASAGGDGALKISASGTAAAHITFTSYGEGPKAIINNTSAADYSDAILTKGASYIDIVGLQFAQATRAAVHVDSTSSRVTVQNSDMAGVGFGVMLEGTSNLITQNYIHDLHMVKNTPKTVSASDDYGANGVLVSGNSNEISYNRIVNARAPSYDYGFDGGGIELSGTIANISIHHNWVEGCAGFIETGGVGGSMSNISISNNTSLDNGNFIVLHNGTGQFAQTYANVSADHNTIVNQFSTASEPATVFLDAPAAAGSFSFKNNIVQLNNGQSVFKQDGTYHSDNLFNLQSSSTHLYTNWSMALGTNEAYGNPVFSDIAAHDLTATSSAAKTYGALLTAADIAKLPAATATTPGAEIAPLVSAAPQTLVHGQGVAASTLFGVADANGDVITQYQVSVARPAADGGRWVLNGVVQDARQTITVGAAEFAKLGFSAGFGADEVKLRAYDGQLWSGWAATTVTGTNAAPVVTISAGQTVGRNTVVAMSSLVSVRDGDGDPITKYQVIDRSTGAASGSLVLNGVAQTADTAVEVAAPDLGKLTLKAGIGPDSLQIRAFDGHDWSAWSGNVVITGVNAAPAVAAAAATVAHGSATALSTLLSATDANGDAIQRYQIIDLTAAPNSGSLRLNGVTQTAGATLDVTAAQFAQLSFSAGSGTDVLQVRAFDGADWSAWTRINVAAPVNAAPVVAASAVSAFRGTSLATASLFSVSDADRDAIVRYQFVDYGTAAGSGTFVLGGVVQEAGKPIELAAGDLAKLAFTTALANDTLSIRAFDGLDWSAWTSLVVKGTNAAPSVTAVNIALAHGAQVAASTLFSAADGNGDAITRYQFTDLTSASESGSFVLDGVAQAAGPTLDTAASNLQSLRFQVGSGTDSIRVRAFDGTDWGAWTTTTVSAPIDSAAIVTASGVPIAQKATASLRSLFTVTDAEGDAVVKYQIADYTSTAASGSITARGATVAANQVVELTATDMAQATFTAGTSADSLAIRAFDGIRWGAWTNLQINPSAATGGVSPPGPVVPNSAPTVTTQDQSVARKGDVVAASALMQARDVDGDPIAAIQLRVLDPTARSGAFTVGGTIYAPGDVVAITADQLPQTAFRAGAGTDVIQARASDGTSWSAWQDVTVTAPANHAATVSAGGAAIAPGASIAVSTLFQAQDADGDAVARYQVIDTATAATSGHLLLAGSDVAANTTLDVSAAQMSQLYFTGGLAGDTLQIRASDGLDWGDWTDVRLTASASHAPVVRDGATATVAHGSTVAAGSLVSVSDPDGDPIVSYQFADLTNAANSGHFVIDGQVLRAGHHVTLSAEQFASATFEGGSGRDTILMRAFDGSSWGEWAKTFVSSPVNRASVVTEKVVALSHDTVVKATSLFAVADAEGDAPMRYQIVETTDRPESGHFVRDGRDVAANTTLDLSTAEMARLDFKAGSTSADFVQARVFDGLDWSNWAAFAVRPTNDAPVATSSGANVARQGTVAASSLFTVTDANHDTITRYQLSDSTLQAGSGFFSIGDAVQAAGQVIDLTAQQFAEATFQGSSFASGDDVAMRAFDGLLWSGWAFAHI